MIVDSCIAATTDVRVILLIQLKTWKPKVFLRTQNSCLQNNLQWRWAAHFKAAADKEKSWQKIWKRVTRFAVILPFIWWCSRCNGILRVCCIVLHWMHSRNYSSILFYCAIFHATGLLSFIQREVARIVLSILSFYTFICIQFFTHLEQNGKSFQKEHSLRLS